MFCLHKGQVLLQVRICCCCGVTSKDLHKNWNYCLGLASKHSPLLFWTKPHQLAAPIHGFWSVCPAVNLFGLEDGRRWVPPNTYTWFIWPIRLFIFQFQFWRHPIHSIFVSILYWCQARDWIWNCLRGTAYFFQTPVSKSHLDTSTAWCCRTWLQRIQEYLSACMPLLQSPLRI